MSIFSISFTFLSLKISNILLLFDFSIFSFFLILILYSFLFSSLNSKNLFNLKALKIYVFFSFNFLLKPDIEFLSSCSSFFFFYNLFFGTIDVEDLLDLILIQLFSLNLFKEFLINIDQSKKFNLFTNSFIISSNKIY